ncbi:hypothetical protein BT96DRAFT_614742 [Gymnopus androsaceus JB14]|uniref:Uncharacterized protein n=1 Tax=Gymnopus androsaceus JB14 TaxID=1447944 RepID=A0A6A4HW72_9AGAR|nr:hypothetical protein BT96DRAFT_614742 [Gymnopus androsaceus JB14]
MDAAQSAFTFFTSQLISGGIVRDGIFGDSCEVGGVAYPYNSGVMMEGMAILNSLQPLPNIYSLYNLISAGTNATTFWQPESAHGVIVSTAGPSAYGHPVGGGDIHLIRGVMAVHTRTVDPLLQNYTASYLAVQYNAAVNEGTLNGTIYGPWVGPPSAQYTLSGPNQTTALSILVNAIGIINSTSSGSPSTNGTASPSKAPSPPISTTSQSSDRTTIIASVVGSLAFLMLMAVGAFLVRKHHSKRQLAFQSKHLSVDAFATNSNHSQPIPPRKAFTDRNTPSISTPGEILPMNGKRQIPYARDIHGLSRNRDNEETDLQADESDNLTSLDSVPSAVEFRVQNALNAEMQNSGNGMTTEELLRLLNQRLQPGPHWEESPPNYSHIG